MENNQAQNIRYFSITDSDEAWGIVVTTVGTQVAYPGEPYPVTQHPDSHNFNPLKGRILKEYQLIYITKGGGFFESQSCRKTRIKPGTVIMLFPNEWHTYRPDPDTGWSEHWVGFRGAFIDKRIDNGFFSPSRPLYEIGISSSILSLYEEIMHSTLKEKSGYQQLVSSMVLFILGKIYYKTKNASFTDSYAIEKINEARSLMRQQIERPESPEEMAKTLGVSYSWFRQMFKKYTGISPLQYQLQLKHLRAKELIERTELTISEVAFRIGFESVGRFCSFFRKREGVSPSQYRQETRQGKKH